MAKHRPPVSVAPPSIESLPDGDRSAVDAQFRDVLGLDKTYNLDPSRISPGDDEGIDPVEEAGLARRVLKYDAPTTYHKLDNNGASGRRRGAPSFTESSGHTPSHAAESRNTEPWKPTSVEKHDRATLRADVKLLGKSYRLERAKNEVAIRSTRRFKLAVAKIRNKVTWPNHAIKQYAKNRAEKSFNNKQTRLKEALAERDMARIEGAGSRILKRRQEAIDRAQAKADISKDRLRDKKDVFDRYTQDRADRITSPHAKEAAKRQEYMKEIEKKRTEALDRKAEALGRKTMRKHLRTERKESRSDTRLTLEEIPKEQLTRVGMVAMTHEASRRETAKAERRSSRADRKFDRANKRVARTESRVKGHEAEENWNSAAASAIEHELSLEPDRERETLGQQIDRLEARLKGFTDYTEEHAQALSELRVARAQRAQLNKSLRHHQREAESSGSLAANAKGKLEWLQPARTKRQEAAINASRAANTQWQREVEDKAALDQLKIQEVLNS